MRSPKAVLLGLICLAVLGCVGEDPDAGLSVLHRGLGTDPESLDPQIARSVQAADVLRDIGEGLMSYSPSGEVVAGAAKSWQVSDDGLSYTFSLREGLRWSNGEALTAEHFVLGLDRLVDPTVAAFYGQMLVDVAEVKATDERTVHIRLARPVPYMLGLLTHPSTFPAYNDRGYETDLDYVSNGAFVLTHWRAGALLQLDRNPNYWNVQAVQLDRVYHHVITEEMAELNRYRSGELHTTSNVPPENFQLVRAQYPEQLRIAPYLGVYYYGFNLTREPFAENPVLRQALSMAIDRELLVERITGRGEVPAYSWVPPGTSNYEPPRLSYARLSQDERNALAKTLYEEAGYDETNPARVELRYNTSETQGRIALAIQAMWRETLGVETTLINEEFQVLLANIRNRSETQAFRGSWIGDYNDAHTFLGLLLSGNPSNMPGYQSAEFDELMHRAADHSDLDRRRLFLEEAERVLLADHALAPLYFYVSKHLVRPEVRGWQDNVLDYHYSQHLSLDAVQ